MCFENRILFAIMLTRRKKIALLLCLRRKRKLAQQIESVNKSKKKRWWIHPLFQERAISGCYNVMFKELEKDETKFIEFFS